MGHLICVFDTGGKPLKINYGVVFYFSYDIMKRIELLLRTKRREP